MPDNPTQPVPTSGSPTAEPGQYYVLPDPASVAPKPGTPAKAWFKPVVTGVAGLVLGAALGIGGTALVDHNSGTNSNNGGFQNGGLGGGIRPSGGPGGGNFPGGNQNGGGQNGGGQNGGAQPSSSPTA